MSRTIDTFPQVTPSATPSDADLAAWQALPRDEQVRRLQARLAHPDCAAATTATMSDILGRAQASAKLRHG